VNNIEVILAMDAGRAAVTVDLRIIGGAVRGDGVTIFNVKGQGKMMG
jgi:hypothetical protein